MARLGRLTETGIMAKGSPAERLARREIDYAEYLQELSKPIEKALERADRVVERIERTIREVEASPQIRR